MRFVWSRGPSQTEWSSPREPAVRRIEHRRHDTRLARTIIITFICAAVAALSILRISAARSPLESAAIFARVCVCSDVLLIIDLSLSSSSLRGRPKGAHLHARARSPVVDVFVYFRVYRGILRFWRCSCIWYMREGDWKSALATYVVSIRPPIENVNFLLFGKEANVSIFVCFSKIYIFKNNSKYRFHFNVIKTKSNSIFVFLVDTLLGYINSRSFIVLC